MKRRLSIAATCIFLVGIAIMAVRLGASRYGAGRETLPVETTGAAVRNHTPNVLLVTLDTTRADHLGCYGREAALTPALDELAARGTLFEQAFPSSPMTLPAHATMFTGLDPPEHGVRVNGKHKLGASLDTLAELLANLGYRTGAFVAAFVLNRKFGLDQGFQTYDDDLTKAHEQEVPEPLSVYRPGDVVVDGALAWLTQVTQERSTADNADRGAQPQPFFAWVHLYDPHYPYHPHAELADTAFADDASYDAEVAFMDRQVARLLDFLEKRRLTEQTMVLAAGDHGEGLEDHGEIEHGYLLNEEVLRVPLIVSLPGTLRAGERIGSMVTLVDLFPTVMDLLGIATPARGRGRSFAPALRDKAELAAHHYREALRIKPDFAAAHYNLANLLREQGETGEAIAHYREALRLTPDNVHAHNNLGVALEMEGEHEEAKAQYLEALRIKPDFPSPHANLGNLFATQGQYAAALTHYAEAVQLGPNAAEPASRPPVRQQMIRQQAPPHVARNRRHDDLSSAACHSTSMVSMTP